MSILLLNVNSLHIPLADKSVQMCVTSPPYYGLHDYGTAEWEGGDTECDHVKPSRVGNNCTTGHNQKESVGIDYYSKVCGKCGAVRIDKQIGLEETPEQYVEKIVAVFREVRRVLKDDGTCWINLGDSYCASPAGKPSKEYIVDESKGDGAYARKYKNNHNGTLERELDARRKAGWKNTDVKPKDLLGIPWMVAFALRADGWYLRSDIIWHKPNPMPESVTDRPTKSHEYLFLLSKSAKYFYDAEAIAEPANRNGHINDVRSGSGKYKDESPAKSGNGNSLAVAGRERWSRTMKNLQPDGQQPNTMHLRRANGESDTEYPARNKRSVWTIATAPYSGAHFATYPPALVEPCILAGTSAKGECPKCGKAWVRTTEKEFIQQSAGRKHISGNQQPGANGWEGIPRGINNTITTDWQPQCTCNLDPVPQIVLDPFGGSGTTAQVTRKLNRYSVCCDLSLNYLRTCARERLQLTALDEFQNGKKVSSDLDGLPMFTEM